MKDNTIMTILAVLCLIIGGFSAVQLFPKTEVKTELVPYNVTEYIVVQDERVEYLYNESIKEDLKEELALQLATDELNSKELKKAIFDLLEAEVSIEDYKHITKIVLKDSEVEVSKENAEVELELKVYFYVDSDEEETEKALLKVIYSVTDLDEDTETELDSVVLVKVY